MAPDKLRPGSASAITLWDSTEPHMWEEALNEYNESIEIVHKNSSKAQSKLSKQSMLDDRKWIDDKLPRLLQEQKHITLAQLERLMVWKLRRGVYRPTLMSLIRKNTDEKVQTVSKSALAIVDKTSSATKVTEACKILTQIHGVGPATASLILSVAVPEVAPFMSDEAMDAVIGLPRAYTLPKFVKFQAAAAKKAEELGSYWNPDFVEKALFSTAMFAKYEISSPIKLDLMK